MMPEEICFSDGVKSPKIALTNAAMALASGGSGGGGSLTASAVGGGKSNPPVYQLSCDNEVKIVKFRYNFLIHNIFERINGELEKLIKVRLPHNSTWIEVASPLFYDPSESMQHG